MSSWERTVSHADKYHCFGKSSFWRTYVLKLLRSARFIRLDESESSAANEEHTACHTSNSQVRCDGEIPTANHHEDKTHYLIRGVMKSAWLYLSLQVGCVLLEREQLMKNNGSRGCEWWSGPRQCGNHCRPFQHLLATQPQPQLAEIWSKTLIEKIIFEGPITDPEKTAKSFCRL